MAIGRITGPMLFPNLERQGVDLAIDGNLIYADVAYRRVGINTSAPGYSLDVPGNVRLANLTVLGNTLTSNTGKIGLGTISNLVVSGGVANNVVITDGLGNLSFINVNTLSAGVIYGNTIPLGVNTAGYLVSNAVTLTTTTTVTDGISQLNLVLGKLVPAQPPLFPGATMPTINGVTSYVMTTVSQIDNTTSSRTVPAGTTVANVLRTSSYTTSNVTTVGPGDRGTVTAYKNGVNMGAHLLIGGPSDNGIFGHLVVGNNVDYGTISGQALGFWESFNCYATGANVAPGWNESYINHTLGSPTSTRPWYFDNSNPGTPTFFSPTIVVSSNVVIYSSTIPHYTSAAGFTLTTNVNRLSGDMFPTSNNMVTGTAGGAFAAPSTVTYAGASVTWPLSANLYVVSGNATVTTTANIISGFSSSATGPSISVSNSYNVGTQAYTTQLANTVLYKTGTASTMEETSIPFGSTVGTGAGLAFRIINPGSTDTPVYTGSEAAFNSQTSTLLTYDATIVAAILKNDQTNYATGYLPIGPNLSTGRTAAQYFTFKFIRTSVSKFNIKFSGTIAGLWVALPGSGIDTSSTNSGWLTMDTAYAGSGQPGAGTGGNGSNGCALGGVVTLNTLVSAHSKTCTFGTASSSSTVTNEIYVRIKLTSGQTVTALSLETSSN